jgi:hypothetical protein
MRTLQNVASELQNSQRSLLTLVLDSVTGRSDTKRTRHHVYYSVQEMVVTIRNELRLRVKIVVFLNVILCGLTDGYQLSGETHSLPEDGDRCSSETFITSYQATHCHNSLSEHHNRNSHLRRSLECYIT